MNIKPDLCAGSYMPLDPRIDCHQAAGLRKVGPPKLLSLISFWFAFNRNLNQRGSSKHADSRQFQPLVLWGTVVKMKEGGGR